MAYDWLAAIARLGIYDDGANAVCVMLSLSDGQAIKPGAQAPETTFFFVGETNGSKLANTLVLMDEERGALLRVLKQDPTKIGPILEELAKKAMGQDTSRTVTCVLSGQRLHWIAGAKSAVLLLRNGKFFKLTAQDAGKPKAALSNTSVVATGVVTLQPDDIVILPTRNPDIDALNQGSFAMNDLALLTPSKLSDAILELFASAAAPDAGPACISVIAGTKHKRRFNLQFLWVGLAVLSWVVVFAGLLTFFSSVGAVQ